MDESQCESGDWKGEPMRHYYLVLAYMVFATSWPSLVVGQAFQNLDFETVQFSEVPGPTDYFEAIATLPGWTFSWSMGNELYLWPHLGSYPQQILITDNFGFDTAPPWPHIPPVQGHYSIFLEEGVNPPDYTPIGPGISQTGMIPADAKSVRFYGGGGFLGGAESLWIVSVNDVPVPVKRFVTGTWLNIPGDLPLYSPIISADISAFAGTVVTLKFALDPEHDHPGWMQLTSGVLDDVRFSTLDYTLIPEPTSVVLAMVCFGIMAASRRRRLSGAEISRGLGRAE
jgi:hypothetical protein